MTRHEKRHEKQYLGPLVRTLRERLNLTQKAFSALVSVSHDHLGRLERGESGFAPDFLGVLRRQFPSEDLTEMAEADLSAWKPPKSRGNKKGPATPEESPNHSQGQDSSPQPPPPAVSDHEQACLNIQAVTNDFEQRTLEARALLQEVAMGTLERPRLFEIRDRCRSVETHFPRQVERFERLLSDQRATTEANRAVLAGLEPDDPDAQGLELDDELLCLRQHQVEAGRECLEAWNLLHRRVSEALGQGHQSKIPIEECIPPRALEALRSQGVQEAEIRSRFPKTDDAILFLIKAAIKESEHGRELIAKELNFAAKEWFIGRFPDYQALFSWLADFFSGKPFRLTLWMIEHLKLQGFPDPKQLQQRLQSDPEDPYLLHWRKEYAKLRDNPHHYLLKLENEKLAEQQRILQNSQLGMVEFR